MKKTADIFGICYKSISFMLVISLIVTPALAQNTNIGEQKPNSTQEEAQTSQVENKNTEQIGGEDITLNAITDARQDAEMEINGGLWFFIGCLGGCIGWIIASAIEPNPPATRLMGKSPEYVAAYTDAYREAAKKIQTSQALTGCLVGTAISTVLQFIIMSN